VDDEDSMDELALPSSSASSSRPTKRRHLPKLCYPENEIFQRLMKVATLDRSDLVQKPETAAVWESIVEIKKLVAEKMEINTEQVAEANSD
jgi:hypothetical protein